VLAEILGQAHQCSARYPAETSEFSAVGLHENFHSGVLAPFVEESRIRYALDLEDIKANNTNLIIGRVQLIELPNGALDHDGGISLAESGTLASTALDTYFSISKVAQLKYAKP
jgi:flavin reductase (DIM6/NTAB) family NADH-FMN oxidoreductase RutF